MQNSSVSNLWAILSVNGEIAKETIHLDLISNVSGPIAMNPIPCVANKGKWPSNHIVKSRFCPDWAGGFGSTTGGISKPPAQALPIGPAEQSMDWNLGSSCVLSKGKGRLPGRSSAAE